MHLQRVAPASLYTPSGKRKYLTRDERARFITAAKAHPRGIVRTLCLTLAYTGCRISEALAIRVHAIEPEAGFIAIRSLKKRNSVVFIREVPVPPDLLNALQDVHDIAHRGRDERILTVSRSRAWQLVKLVMTEAGISCGIHTTPKGLRHGFGLHAIQSGVPLNLVQRWLGHARMETTAIYLQALGCEEREIASRMW